MNKPVWIVMLLVGLAVLLAGVGAANSAASEASTSLTGTPTDQALWLMVGGGTVALLGAAGLVGSSRTHHVN
jgi:hypothetical protein